MLAAAVTRSLLVRPHVRNPDTFFRTAKRTPTATAGLSAGTQRTSGGVVRVVQTDEAHSGKSAIQWDLSGKGWIMVMWSGFNAPNGVPRAGFKYVTFWARITGQAKPGNIHFRLQSTKEDEGAAARFQDVLPYCPALADGAWHEVAVPLAGVYAPKQPGEAIIDFHIGVLAVQPVDCTIWLDDIALSAAAPATQPAR